MTTAGLAARLDFTLDDIEDLRMAVGEACALVLEHADPRVTCTPRSTSATARSGSRSRPTPLGDSEPDVESFGWQVLTALTSDVVTSREGRLRWVSFTVRSSIAA